MKKLVLGSIMFASMFTVSALADEMKGVVSDSMCGAKHVAATEKDAACAKKCIKGGSDPVLLSDGKVLKFDAASKDKAVALAGKKVKVDGTLDGDTVKVTSIEAAD